MAIKSLKTIILTFAMATGSMATLLEGSFAPFFGADCTNPLGAATIADGYCVNLESFPSLSLEAYTISGACADSSASPVVSIYTDPGCETGLIESFVINAQAKCIELDATIQSVTLNCVSK